MKTYIINIAQRATRGPRAGQWVWFCRVDAGTAYDHAERVYFAMLNRYPMPDFEVKMMAKTEILADVDPQAAWEKKA